MSVLGNDIQKLICKDCGGHSFVDDYDNGYKICGDCGAQSIEYLESGLDFQSGKSYKRKVGKL